MGGPPVSNDFNYCTARLVNFCRLDSLKTILWKVVLAN